ncbi:MAG: 50S ribosomal protein L18 [Mariniblastus sp.]|nr:50S ribosomal protein L18 [Mariniblastus sp.]
MRKQKIVNKQRWRRTNRVRKKLRGDADCPRLSVRRSNKHLYCQLIDDDAGKTLASASTRDKTISGQIGYGGNCDAAKIIGSAIAERAKELGVTQARFDRGPYKFHGRVAELANAAREGGLNF